MNAAPSLRLLIAEDDRAFLKALTTYLSAPNREILVAHDGGEAVRILGDASATVEIVLTDLVMPGVDGLCVLRSALEIDPHIVVILMTGYGSIDTAVRAMKEGAFDYKAKPFLLEEMELSIQRAESYLRLRQERDRLFEEIKSLRERLMQMEKEAQPATVRVESQEADREAAASRLRVLSGTLNPHDAFSSYQLWGAGGGADEDLKLLGRLKDQGILSLDQYCRLRSKLKPSRTTTL
jgi:DNA-binding NtrC family response regulator